MTWVIVWKWFGTPRRVSGVFMSEADACQAAEQKLAELPRAKSAAYTFDVIPTGDPT